MTFEFKRRAPAIAGVPLPYLCAAAIAASAGGGWIAPPAFAAAPPAKNAATPDADADAPNTLQDDIVVTGHRPHDLVETEVRPEVSLNSAVIQSLGAVDLAEVFKELAAELGTAPPSAGAPGRFPTVLVNGQRIAGFSSIKDFPPEAIARIDVFPERVALQYGYGPDQRVVNVVLRDNYHALTLVGRYTLAPKTWRNVYRTKIDIVRIGETSHWNAGLDFSHQDAVFAATTITNLPVAPGDAIPDHTLASQNDHLTASATANGMVGRVNAEIAGSLDFDTLQSRPGLSQEDGALLASQGLNDIVSGPYSRVDQTVHAGTNLTANGKFGGWRWSFVGRLDDTMRETRTTSALGAGELDMILLPSPGLLGEGCATPVTAGCVSTNSRRASGDFYLNGDLWSLPGGAVTAALRTGFAFTGVYGDSLQQHTSFARSEGSAQANLDFPITARESAIGKLLVGANGEVHQLTAFGTLATVGGSVDWQPDRAVALLVSYSQGKQAPTLLQLGQALLTTPDLREYDFVSGGTTIIARTEGGSAGLIAASTQATKARLQLMPLRAVNLTLSAEYTIEQVRNPILTLTAATSAAVAAFPTHFRSENGFVTAIDITPINAARRDSQQVRWGINYATNFGGNWRNKDGSASDRRNQFQIALYDTWHTQDEIRLANGQPTLNLLGGDLIYDDGGTPAHRIELQTSVTTHAMSVDVSGVWQTPTKAYADPTSAQQLTFSQGITVNLRWQINLAAQRWLTRIFPHLKGSLNLSADNVLDAHLRAHEANGSVPSAYAESYLNPTGRTLRITLRKRFR